MPMTRRGTSRPSVERPDRLDADEGRELLEVADEGEDVGVGRGRGVIGRLGGRPWARGRRRGRRRDRGDGGGLMGARGPAAGPAEPAGRRGLRENGRARPTRTAEAIKGCGSSVS
ncbi:MAG: hypothetical protein MZV64_64190 [Ignavibacteriales bacterium]|nr:hypothetical protein [Ignavibacteriales bacterium]